MPTAILEKILQYIPSENAPDFTSEMNGNLIVKLINLLKMIHLHHLNLPSPHSVTA